MVKILFVGMGQHPMYDKAFYEAGQNIENVESDYFAWWKELGKKNIFIRAENKLSLGPDVVGLNWRLIKKCKENHYDIVFIYTCRFVFPKTVKKLRALGCYVAIYCNDDPFSDFFPAYFWRHWRNSIKYGNITYVYRLKNIEECREYGSKEVKILRSYYMKSRNYYIPDEEIDMEVPEVVFLGHREDDERIEHIRALTAAGIRVGLPNVDEWKDFETDSKFIVKFDDSEERYNEILNKAKIALVFLSKINHDTYTRRCFEIPAVKTLMMSVYTEDIASLYEEDEEIVFFRNKEELVEKVQYYLNNPQEIQRITDNCLVRLQSEGHSAEDRVRTVIQDYYNRQK